MSLCGMVGLRALGLQRPGFLVVKHFSVLPSHGGSRSRRRKRLLFSGGIQIFFSLVLFCFQVMIKLCVRVGTDWCECKRVHDVHEWQ